MNAQFARVRGWPGEPFSHFGTPNLKRRMARDITPLKGQVLRSDFILLRRHVGLPRFLFLSLPFTEAHVRYDLDAFSNLVPMYDTIWMRSRVRYQSQSHTYYDT